MTVNCNNNIGIHIVRDNLIIIFFKKVKAFQQLYNAFAHYDKNFFVIFYVTVWNPRCSVEVEERRTVTNRSLR